MRVSNESVRRRLLGVPVLAATVLAALMTPVVRAEAATSVSGATNKPAAVRVPVAGGSAAPTGASGSKAEPAARAKPTAPPKPKPAPAVSPAEARKLRAAAGVRALAAATVPNTCGGGIQPDTVYPCTGSTGPDNFTVQLTNATDLLQIEVTSPSGVAAPSLTAPDASAVSCRQTIGPWLCATTVAGTYTLTVNNNGTDFTVAYLPVLSDTTCVTADTSFTAPYIQGSLDPGSAGDCYIVNLPSGSVLSYAGGELDLIFDATGAQVCNSTGDCALTGTAPYRMTVSEPYGGTSASTYTLRLNSLTNPQGCLVVGQQTYGQVPDSSSTDRCRSLTVATAGSYQIYEAGGLNSSISTLYNLDGTVACTNYGPFCTLAAGTYSYVLHEDVSITPYAFGVVFIAADESRGCVPVGDTDFATGPATGAFSGLGEEICLTLPTPAAKADYVLNEPTADRSFPAMQVIDATGVQQCADQDYTYHVCAMSGTAPFRLVLSNFSATQAYKELVQRTDSAAGCTLWPQSGFGGSWGAQVSLTPSAPAVCLSIPANAHSAGEMIDYSNTDNTMNAGVYVNDPAGNQICRNGVESLTFCSYTAGVAYTALLTTSLTITDTYHMVRRDVSNTAPCAAPASTVPGGPSTQVLLTSDLDAACFRAAAAATDYWWADVRAVAPNKAGAVLTVTDPAGKIVCWQWGVSCNVTGSAGYQIIVIASGYAGETIAAHVDTWRVGTASGWASQCTAHQLSQGGFPVQGATLTESSTAYCAVVPMQPSQNFSVWGSDTATGQRTVAIRMFLRSDWTNGIGLCGQQNVGSFWFYCGTRSTDPAGEAVFLVTPGAAPTPVSYLMQGVTCKYSCGIPPVQATISSISPAQGVAGMDRVTVTGSGLSFGTRVNLAANGSVVSNAYGQVPISVSPDGTSLTVQIDTFGVTPGTYDVVLDSPGYTTGTPSPGYLPKAFTVTAPPPTPAGLLMPVGPTRVLDTRHGVGARQAKVAAGGVLPLQVDGVAGVPASGVTAVVMNVTVTDTAAGGYLTVYPDGAPRPVVSNLNFGAGETIPNLVTVPVVNGKVDFFNGSGGTLDLIADITGYYTSTGSGSAFDAIGPTRVLDTRHGVGARQAKVAAGGVLPLQVDGVAGVPASGVTAVVMNVTVTDTAAGGYLTVYPDGAPRPVVSNLNFGAGETIPNLVTVPVVNGKVDLFNGSGGTLDLIADITGYYSSTGSSYHPVGPVRAMDTRNGVGGAGGVVPAGAAAVLPVMGALGNPNANVTAVVLNVTVTAPAAGGYLTVYPDGASRPVASNLNFSAGETIPNLVVVPVVNGNIDFHNGSPGNVQIIADVAGYFSS